MKTKGRIRIDIKRGSVWSLSEICLVGTFTAAIVIIGKLSIPMPLGVPMTLQTFIIPLAAIVLGWKRGVTSLFIYLILGIFIPPIFSGPIIGPTGGFIISFPLMAYITGLGADKSQEQDSVLLRWIYVIGGVLAGMAANFIFGMLVYSIYMSCGLKQAFAGCVVPFLPVSIIKAVIAVSMGVKIRDMMEKRNLLV